MSLSERYEAWLSGGKANRFDTLVFEELLARQKAVAEVAEFERRAGLLREHIHEPFGECYGYDERYQEPGVKGKIFTRSVHVYCGLMFESRSDWIQHRNTNLGHLLA